MTTSPDLPPDITQARDHEDFVIAKLAEIAESDSATPSECLAALKLMLQRLNAMAGRETE